jgi:hypothetical protein
MKNCTAEDMALILSESHTVEYGKNLTILIDGQSPKMDQLRREFPGTDPTLWERIFRICAYQNKINIDNGAE